MLVHLQLIAFCSIYQVAETAVFWGGGGAGVRFRRPPSQLTVARVSHCFM